MSHPAYSPPFQTLRYPLIPSGICLPIALYKFILSKKITRAKEIFEKSFHCRLCIEINEIRRTCRY